MLPPAFERRLLQIVIGVLGLVPVGAGAGGVLLGLDFFADLTAASADGPSHFRYLSGIFLGVGLAFWSTIPAIEHQGARFRLLAALVVLGGLARLASLGLDGVPSLPHRIGLSLELLAVPLLAWWQAGMARRFNAGVSLDIRP